MYHCRHFGANLNGRLAPVHPGEVLMKDFIELLGITSYKVAKLAGVQQFAELFGA